MSDLPDQSPPSRRATGRSGRRARFVLPADHHDESVGERIEAFLEGPPAEVRRGVRSRAHRSAILHAIRPAVPLDTRTDWEAAVRHEDARIARYGRPAAVLVVRLRMPLSAGVERFAARAGAILREQARATDRVTRAAPDRFHVLLPEASAADADALAERVRDACAEAIPGQPGADLEILAGAASPALGQTLHEALRQALREVAD